VCTGWKNAHPTKPTPDAGGADRGVSTVAHHLVATAGDHGAWVWDTRTLDSGPTIKLGNGRASTAATAHHSDESALAEAANEPSSAAAAEPNSTKSCATTTGITPECCAAICFHPKDEHTVLSSAGATVRWHDLRAPSAPSLAVGGDDENEINQISVNDRGSHLA
jgi:hypothetical protein